ncbi:hypothetical protein ACI3L1_18690 [Deinococcus sp. SM5_A1]|uniref:hypothetical protein n=1 Tax=Deinococcus sp. SM5_A1 TaxID=3379094 RepID=UPI00385D448C
MTGPYAAIQLLNWHATGTVLLAGRAELVSAWAAEKGYTRPQPALPGLYLIDAQTIYYVSADGSLVRSAAHVVQSLKLTSPSGRGWTNQAAYEALAVQDRIFVLSELDSFAVANLMLRLFGLRKRPVESLRRR